MRPFTHNSGNPLAAHVIDGDTAPMRALLERALAEYSQPKLPFHNLDHAETVAARCLAEANERANGDLWVASIAVAAGWIHHLLYRPGSASNSFRGVNVAFDYFTRFLPSSAIKRIAGAACVTADYPLSCSRLEATIVRDSDLADLAVEPAIHHGNLKRLALEWNVVGRPGFIDARRTFIGRQLQAPRIFSLRTDLEARARRNLQHEWADLGARAAA